MIAPEVHHREQHVLYSFTQPALCILMHGRVGIPVIGRIAAQVAEFAHGRRADLDPRFGSFHGPIHRPYTAGHVVATPVGLVLPLAVFAVRARIVEFRRVFRITDIVEMDAVYVIVRSYFTAEGSQIVGGLRLPRVEIPTVSMAYAKFGMGFQYGTVSHTCGSGYLETRYGYKPRMQFHPSFVAFPDGKGQGVISRRTSRSAGQAAVPRFDGRRIDDTPPHAGLQQHGVDVHFLEPVEDAAQFILLCLDAGRGCSFVLRPVQTTERGQPHGPGFPFGEGQWSETLRGHCRQAAGDTYI